MVENQWATLRAMRMRVGVAFPLAAAALWGAGLAALGAGAQYPLLFSAVLAGIVLVASLIGVRWLGLVGVMLWAYGSVGLEHTSRLPAGLSGVDLSVEARIISASETAGVTRLMLDVKRCQAPAGLPGCARLGKVRVSAYHKTALRAGERWHMTLRLRPPRGFSNPHSFDYGAWLWREGIHATGYVRQIPEPERLAPAGIALETPGACVS